MTPIILEAVTRLPATRTKKESLEKALKWILDAMSYVGLTPSHTIPTTALSSAEVGQLVAAGQARELEEKETPLGGVRVFTVTELAKARRRVIKHTAEINHTFGRDTLVPVQMPTRAEQSAQATKGEWALTLDFSAFFDQFELAAEVQRRMCFRRGGKVYALTRMPMGQRHSVAIAQHTTERLLDFPMPNGVTSQAFVDNVRFVGPRDKIVKATMDLLARCAACGVTVNEVCAASATQGEVEALAHQKGEWLGAEYDYAACTQRLTPKTLAKIEASWKQREKWTTKQYAAHLGLLFFATSVLRLNPAAHFEAIKRLRERARQVNDNEALWGATVHLVEGERESLRRWTVLATENAAVRCPNDLTPTRVLMTDASDWGWGAIMVDLSSGRCQQAQHAWTEQDRAGWRTGVSSHAEPEAIYRALCTLVRPSEVGNLMVLTDSTTAKWALRKGMSPSFEVNAVVNRVRRTFPNLQLSIEHIAGSTNLADGLSRGASQPLEQVEQQAIRRAEAAVKGGTMPH